MTYVSVKEAPHKPPIRRGNRVSVPQIGAMGVLFGLGVSVRRTARLMGVHRDTAMRERARWRFGVDKVLQRAYDVLWDGDDVECDRLLDKVPDDQRLALLDDWLDDQMAGEGDPKSRWH